MPLPDTGTDSRRRRGLVKVRCVDNAGYEQHLDVGVDYELLAWEEGLVRVIDNDGIGYLYDPARFAEILDDGTVGLRLEYPTEFFENAVRGKYAGKVEPSNSPENSPASDPHDCEKEHGELPHWVTVEPVVTIEREKLDGAPSIRGQRVGVAQIVDLVAHAAFERSLEDLKHDLRIHYGLTVDDAAACLRYAADTVRALRRAPDFVRGYYTEEQQEAELDKRVRSVDDGRDETVPWEDVKARLREQFVDADEHLPEQAPREWHMTTSGKFVLPEHGPVDVVGRALYWQDIAQQLARQLRRLGKAINATRTEQPDTIVERAIVRLRDTPERTGGK